MSMAETSPCVAHGWRLGLHHKRSANLWGGRWLRGKIVADAHLGDDIAWMRGVSLDLAPEPIHVDLEQMAFADVLLTPYVFQQQILGDDAASILRQIG